MGCLGVSVDVFPVGLEAAVGTFGGLERVWVGALQKVGDGLQRLP